MSKNTRRRRQHIREHAARTGLSYTAAMRDLNVKNGDKTPPLSLPNFLNTTLRPLTVITGMPGIGKTWTALEIVARAFSRDHHLNIFVVTPEPTSPALTSALYAKGLAGTSVKHLAGIDHLIDNLATLGGVNDPLPHIIIVCDQWDQLTANITPATMGRLTRLLRHVWVKTVMHIVLTAPHVNYGDTASRDNPENDANIMPLVHAVPGGATGMTYLRLVSGTSLHPKLDQVWAALDCVGAVDGLCEKMKKHWGARLRWGVAVTSGQVPYLVTVPNATPEPLRIILDEQTTKIAERDATETGDARRAAISKIIEIAKQGQSVDLGLEHVSLPRSDVNGLPPVKVAGAVSSGKTGGELIFLNENPEPTMLDTLSRVTGKKIVLDEYVTTDHREGSFLYDMLKKGRTQIGLDDSPRVSVPGSVRSGKTVGTFAQQVVRTRDVYMEWLTDAGAISYPTDNPAQTYNLYVAARELGRIMDAGYLNRNDLENAGVLDLFDTIQDAPKPAPTSDPLPDFVTPALRAGYDESKLPTDSGTVSLINFTGEGTLDPFSLAESVTDEDDEKAQVKQTIFEALRFDHTTRYAALAQNMAVERATNMLNEGSLTREELERNHV